MYDSIYFSTKETGCRCGKCGGQQGMPDELLIRLDMWRKMCGFPIPMTSGYRCPLHHENPNGPHSIGAGDFALSHRKGYIALQKAMLLRFTGIGIKQKGNNRFIHLDDCLNTSDRPRPTLWSY